MITSVDEWIVFLKSIHLAGGFPLVIAGLVLMFFGWRMWKVCVVLAFGAVGAIVTTRLTDAGPNQWLYALVGAVIFAVASSIPVRHSIVVLGGIIVMGMAYYYLADRHLDAPVLYAAMGIALFGGIAYSAINRRRIVIFVTAFLGAVLLISGITNWLSAFPGLFGTFQSMARSSAIVVPFVLLVPSVMSAFYQIAEVRRLQVEL